jgi:predicted GIY-YIG superfamily endonuclease
MSFYVYILASQRNGTLYVGMTDNLGRRVWQHREGLLPGFTKEYGVNFWSGTSSTNLENQLSRVSVK